MKNILLLLLFFCSLNAVSQISEGGMPYSFSQGQLKSQVVLPEYKLKRLEDYILQKEDAENPSPYRYSIFEEVNIDLKTGAESEINDPKGTIWRYTIASEKAYSIQIVFKTFLIPEGAKLFVYNNDYSTVYGAYTKQNVQVDNTFTIADFQGKNVILEYFEPFNAEFKGIVKIGYIGQAYKDISLYQIEKAEQADFIDVNCAEGRTWQNEKHAVCKITFRVGNSGYLCSGALINNTSNDGTPYFLTANHCIGDTTAAKTLVAYFNYEKRSCNGALDNARTLSGARMLSTGTKSDYTLLRLNNKPSSIYLPYYAGWDIRDYQDNQNISIHHPEGIEKKISIDNDKIITYDKTISWDEGETTPPSTHWLVNFDIGLTSGGSSGAPLFSKQKRIIGQLHGGGDEEEYFGKLQYSWTNNSTGFQTLKKFLDPTNSGITFLDGYVPSTNLPDAYFSTNMTDVCINSPVTLYDYSAFSPSSREWIVTPATFAFVNNTNKNSINPQMQFSSTGPYTIRLNSTNANGTDSVQVKSAINVGTTLNVNLTSSLGDTLCYYNFDSLILTGFGAETYSWKLVKQSIDPFYFSSISGDTAILKVNRNIQVNSSYSLNVNLTGAQGTCTGSTEKTINFAKILNDNIANAIEIGLGTTDSLTNFCATIETNEPVPPADSCTSLNAWCDEYGTGIDIVENSVWFKFKGPATGKASLKSEGFDNEIAIYDANSYQDILNGNFAILAANDDQSEVNPNPLIPEVTVQAGKTYWIQVDGSGGGSEGTFKLTLSDKNTTAISNKAEYNSLLIYPQPVQDYLTILNKNIQNNTTEIKIYSLSGQLYHAENLTKADGNKATINVSDLSPGIYLLKITSDKKLIVSKFIKK